MIVNVFFHNIGDGETRNPYVTEERSIRFECDEKEGTIYFNGYYYIENHAPPYPEDEGLEGWERQRHSEWLPQKKLMSLYYGYKTPCNEKCKEDNRCSHGEFSRSANGECDVYEIEIYKKETHESTDAISKVEDANGEEMDICFFSTDFITLHFRVLTKTTCYSPMLMTLDQLLPSTKE
jgi:hypothetical protein